MSDHALPISTAALAAHPQPDATAPASPGDAIARSEAQTGEPWAVDAAQGEKECVAEQAAKPILSGEIAHAAQDNPCALASAMTDAILPDNDVGQKDAVPVRWRACRCGRRPAGTAQQKAVSHQGGGALWPYVAVVLALAGALVLAVWLDDTARAGDLSAGNLAAALVGANATLDATSSPVPVSTGTIASASDQDNDSDNNRETSDDNAWCACLCQPKGPLMAGRIVDDQCVCQCLAPAQQSLPAASHHSYALCVATIVQMGSFLIAAIALGCILTF